MLQIIRWISNLLYGVYNSIGSPLLKLERVTASSHLPLGSLGETTLAFCRSATTHLHPQLDRFPPPPTNKTPHSHLPQVFSSLLPAGWAIYRRCFIPTPAGRQSCHSGPTEPLWSAAWEWKCTLLMQRLILVTFSQQPCVPLFCCACVVRYVVKR